MAHAEMIKQAAVKATIVKMKVMAVAVNEENSKANHGSLSP